MADPPACIAGLSAAARGEAAARACAQPSRLIEEVKFARDSPLEEDGFELVVPLSKRTAVPSSPFGFPVDGTGWERLSGQVLEQAPSRLRPDRGHNAGARYPLRPPQPRDRIGRACLPAHLLSPRPGREPDHAHHSSAT